MNTKLATSCFIIGTLLSPLAAQADNERESDRSHPITFVKDSLITAKVKAMLGDEKLNTMIHVKVDTDAKGGVVLSGTARAQADADKAVSIAHTINGVTSVMSNIQIKKED